MDIESDGEKAFHYTLYINIRLLAIGKKTMREAGESNDGTEILSMTLKGRGGAGSARRGR